MKRKLAGLLVVSSSWLGGCVVATSSSGGSGGGGFLMLLLPMLLVVFMFRMVRRMASSRSRVRARPAATGQAWSDTTMIRAELSVLADDVLRLEADVALHEGARNDYESAVHPYRVAQAAVEHRR